METGKLYLKVLHLPTGLELHLKEQILSHQALQEALNDPKNGESAFKHLKQQVWSDLLITKEGFECEIVLLQI